MKEEFVKDRKLLHEKFDTLTIEMKGKVSEHADNLRQAFHQDLKI